MLAYADLAGMPPATGLLVAAAAGVPAALFASSPFLQTGPVAVTALLTFGSLSSLAEPATSRYMTLAAVLAVLVGIIRLALALTRSGALGYLMSEPVVLGFTPGAAVVIAMTQLAELAGMPEPKAAPVVAAGRVLSRPGNWKPATLAVSVVVVLLLLAGRRHAPQVPTVLLVVAASIGLVAAGYATPVVGALPALAETLPSLPGLGTLGALLVPAAVIAVIGFGDVAAISRTYATTTRTHWDPNQEFLSQGIANVASGLVGGFPVGGLFSRTAVAVEAGARSPWTGAIASMVLVASLPAAGLLARLPQATLAAIVVVSVLGLLKLGPLLALRRYSRQQFAIALTTFALTLATAPAIHWALVVGIMLSIGAHLRRELLVDVPHDVVGSTLHLHPTGVLYFASAHFLLDQCRETLLDEPVDGLVIHLDRLGRVDVSGALALRELVHEAIRLDVQVELEGATETSRKIVERVLDDLPVTVRRTAIRQRTAR